MSFLIVLIIRLLNYDINHLRMIFARDQKYL